jgi:putative Holliday junction resolvase
VIGRTAAVDVGRRRIGLAVCDALGITVRGLDTVEAKTTPVETVEAVAAVLREEGVLRVVVGLPLHADGRESESSGEARRFGAALSLVLAREVVFHDEGLTSWEAEEGLKAAGKRLKDARRSGEVDRRAAIAILRSWLQTQVEPPPTP